MTREEKRAWIDDILAARGITPPRCGFDVGPGWLPHVEAAKEWRLALEQDLEVAATSVEALMDEQKPLVQEIATLRARIEAGIAAAVCIICGGACENGAMRCPACDGSGMDNRVVAALRGNGGTP